MHWPRGRSTGWPSSRACSLRPSAARWRRPMPDVGALAEGLAVRPPRGGLLARVGRALVAGAAGGVVAKAIKPGEAEAYHFCGHIYTTASCPHSTYLPRVDVRGLPLRAKDRVPADD